VLEEGHEHGLLADIQNRLVGGLLNTTRVPVESNIEPGDHVPGLPATASREQMLDHARHHQLAEIPLHHEQEPGNWFACVRAIELATRETPIEDLLIELPRVTPNTSRLEALMQLNAAAAPIAAVVDDNQAIGLVHHRQLTEQLFEWQAPV
jgi:CBS domain containing-hemolysin-like protein